VLERSELLQEYLKLKALIADKGHIKDQNEVI
jgi:hypothetical protein